jgi:SM-20-related protein
VSAADAARAATATRSFLPPYRVLPDFLQPAEVESLLAHVAARQSAFAATRVGPANNGRIDPALRVSASLKDLGEFKALLKARLRGMAEALIADLRVSPFVTTSIELELVAHGDGAFYRRHIDTGWGTERPQIRVISGVYYFHRQPQGFAGGALRLHAIGDPDRCLDVEPVHNTLVVFPSWAPHEVRPVSCPSGQFMDSRFAINCWLYARRPGMADKPG